MRKFLFAAALTVALAGCGADDTVYPLAAKDVRSILIDPQTTKIPAMLEMRLVRAPSDPKGLHWDVLARDDELVVARLTARIEDAGDGRTRVTVSGEPPATTEGRNISERLPSYEDFLRYSRAVLREQIDARLDRREFNVVAVAKDGMVAMAGMTRDMQSGAHGATPSEEMRGDGEEPDGKPGQPVNDLAANHQP